MDFLIKKRHDITFNRTGEISLCKKLTDELNVSCGDFLNFVKEGCEFMVGKAAYGAKLRKANKGGGYLRCNSSVIAAMVIPKGEQCAAFRTGGSVERDGNKYVYILTRQPCTRRKE